MNMPAIENNEISRNNQMSCAGKYLTFVLKKEIYGLEILKVQEIIGMMDVTRMPRTPNFIRGVINLRGRVIPVVDLRVKFDLEPQADTERTCIIVVHIRKQDKDMTMGIIVDEVSEVCDIVESQIEETPSFGANVGVDIDFILGMGKFENYVVMLLDIDKVLTGGELDLLSQC